MRRALVPLSRGMLEAAPHLVIIGHVWREGLFTRTANHRITWVRLPDDLGENLHVIGSMVAVQHQLGKEARQCLSRPAQRFALGAFDVHLDEVDPWKMQARLSR